MNIVLLHGSWHGAWCWHKVVPHLTRAGHAVTVPDLPAHGRSWASFRGRITLASMARSVCRLLDQMTEPALLVAHSRGGIVASTVAEMRPAKLCGTVYLAAYMLRDGERVADQIRADRESLVRPKLQVNKFTMTDMLAEDAYRPALYADCSDEDVALARALLTPEPTLPALTRLRLTNANYGSVKRHYIELLEDRAITIAAQKRMIEASPCSTVTSIHASHSAYFSQPLQLSEIIQSVATH